jgi:hypothetical protein
MAASRRTSPTLGNVDIGDQYGKARENLQYALARQGLTSSSAANQGVADLEGAKAKAQGDLNLQAQDAATKVRQQVDQEKQAAISQLYATEDPSLAANTALSKSATILADKPNYNSLGDIFGSVIQGFGNVLGAGRASGYFGGAKSPPPFVRQEADMGAAVIPAIIGAVASIGGGIMNSNAQKNAIAEQNRQQQQAMQRSAEGPARRGSAGRGLASKQQALNEQGLETQDVDSVTGQLDDTKDDRSDSCHGLRLRRRGAAAWRSGGRLARCRRPAADRRRRPRHPAGPGGAEDPHRHQGEVGHRRL